ncbi:MAG TPA: class I SAM-dependent methyltransferase [Acidimicrobiales bacterium]|nr:class I SAM-dependent methyltransferase [Acidimicrobiales bacterium]
MAFWDERYRATTPEERSWTEPSPTATLEILDRLDLAPTDPIVDVGGGASRLVDALLERGFSDLTVLDLAESALAEARARLGAAADRVTWVCADVTAWRPERTYALWHDRAVFHFLIEPAARGAYRDRLERATASGSYAVLATFAPDGPDTCSGLPVTRWAPAELAAEIGDAFEPLLEGRREHVTPWGSTQPFTWLVARRL